MINMILLCDQSSTILSPENITAGTTVLLALITGFYAYWTWKMVKIQKKELEISNRPYISVMTMDSKVENNSIKYIVAIKNSGKIPALLTSSEVLAFNENETENKSLGKSLSTIVVNPGEFIRKDIIVIDNYTSPRKLTFHFEINYKSPVNKDDSYYTKYVYKFDSMSNFDLSIQSTELE